MRAFLLISTSIAASLLLPAAAQSQIMPGEAGTPEAVVISASMLNKTIIENTQAVTVITEGEIHERGFTDLTEILRGVPGLEFKKGGAPGQFDQIKLRGFATSILFVVDGVKINEPSSGQIGNLIGQIDPSIIQRIEILRGPQATIYGADSTAGVISIATKDGSVNDAHVTGEFGSLDWKKGMAGVRGSTSLGGGTVSYSLNGSKLDTNGVWQYEFTHNQTVQGRLDYTLGKFAAGASYYNTINKFQYAELSEAFCCQTPATYWSWQTPDPHQYSGTVETIANVYGRYEILDGLTAKLSYGGFDRYYSLHDAADGLLGSHPAPYDGFDFNFSGTTYHQGDPVPITDTFSAVDSVYRDRRRQGDATIAYTQGMLQGLLGFEYLRETGHQSGTYGDSGGKQGVYSYYGLGQWKPIDDLTLAAGGRVDDYSYSWGTETTYNLGASYRVTSNVDLFVNYGTSFTAPTMRQLYDPTYGTTGLKPESGKTIEGGVRLNFFDNRLQANLTYWNSDVDDIILFDFSKPNPKSTFGFGIYSNAAEGKTDGVEMDAQYALTPNLRLTANYTYTDAIQQNAAGLWTTAVQIAKNKGNLGILYLWNNLTLGANLYLTGPRLRWAADVQSPGYVRLDVSARYRFFDHWSVYGRIENVLDMKIIEELGYKQPRMFGIGGIEYSFY